MFCGVLHCALKHLMMRHCMSAARCAPGLRSNVGTLVGLLQSCRSHWPGDPEEVPHRCMGHFLQGSHKAPQSCQGHFPLSHMLTLSLAGSLHCWGMLAVVPTTPLRRFAIVRLFNSTVVPRFPRVGTTRKPTATIFFFWRFTKERQYTHQKFGQHYTGQPYQLHFGILSTMHSPLSSLWVCAGQSHKSFELKEIRSFIEKHLPIAKKRLQEICTRQWHVQQAPTVVQRACSVVQLPFLLCFAPPPSSPLKTAMSASWLHRSMGDP